MSIPNTSKPGSPFTIQFDRASAMALPCENPAMQPVASQKLRNPRTGPTSGLPSGVNVNAPCTQRRMPTSASTGKRAKPIDSSGSMRSRSGGNNSMPNSHGAPSVAQCRGSRSYTPSSTPPPCGCR